MPIHSLVLPPCEGSSPAEARQPTMPKGFLYRSHTSPGMPPEGGCRRVTPIRPRSSFWAVQTNLPSFSTFLYSPYSKSGSSPVRSCRFCDVQSCFPRPAGRLLAAVLFHVGAQAVHGLLADHMLNAAGILGEMCIRDRPPPGRKKAAGLGAGYTLWRSPAGAGGQAFSESRDQSSSVSVWTSASSVRPVTVMPPVI